MTVFISYLGFTILSIILLMIICVLSTICILLFKGSVEAIKDAIKRKNK